tara:strand:+ start:140 stop:409 length:270 start_codon:yes stop_codon:yes gene_type:complete
MVKPLDKKSLLLGALVAAIFFACADANNTNPIVPKANAAVQGGQNTEIGRFVFHETSPTHILDTTTGIVYYGAQFDEGPWKKHHWLEEE